MSGKDLEANLHSKPTTTSPILLGGSTSDPNDGSEVVKKTRTELEVFQMLLGIRYLKNDGSHHSEKDTWRPAATVFQDIFLPSRAAAARLRNRGLYDRAVSQDMKNRVMYGLSHYIITGLYLLQILIAAALTGLAASVESSKVALTVLGAVNTVLAGVLAWLRGQGMPVRFRRARDQYREVVHAIETSERIFAEIDHIEWDAGKRPTPYSERDRLEKLYNNARIDQEANYPEQQNGPQADQLQEENLEQRERLVADEKRAKENVAKFKAEVAARESAFQAEREAFEKERQGVREREGVLNSRITKLTEMMIKAEKGELE